MRILLALLLLVPPIWSYAQEDTSPAAVAPALSTTPSAPKSQISFKEISHDFGSIKQGDKVEYTFEYTNSGQAPLILANVQTTCGCTSKEWNKTPLAPGKSSSLKITFNSKGKVGRQNKVISVFSNAVNPEERVRIVANVLPPDGNPSPQQTVEEPSKSN